MIGGRQQLIVIGTAIFCAALLLLVFQWARTSSLDERLFKPLDEWLEKQRAFQDFQAARDAPAPKVEPPKPRRPKGKANGSGTAAEPPG